ncbi:MAG: ABC transporter ATP-binding protein [Actinomycetota bacterium]
MSVVLELDGVTKDYPGGVRANDGISLTVDRGAVFGLLGPNGAGKTTMVGQILGLIAPTAGTIRIDGVDVVRRPAVARRACSYQPQSGAPIRGLTPVQAIELTARIRGLSRSEARGRTERLLEALDLTEWRRRVVTQLSGGVARLVSFCMAAVAPGQVVILDEPTNDVDPLRRKLLWGEVQRLAQDGSAVLLVTHNVLEAERCVDRLAIIDHGRVVGDGTPAAIKRELGATLRIEVVLDPLASPPAVPPFLRGPVVVGRRFVADVRPAEVSEAVIWARTLQERRIAEEFSVGPATLEDAYVRWVQPRGEDEGVGAHAAAVG